MCHACTSLAVSLCREKLQTRHVSTQKSLETLKINKFKLKLHCPEVCYIPVSEVKAALPKRNEEMFKNKNIFASNRLILCPLVNPKLASTTKNPETGSVVLVVGTSLPMLKAFKHTCFIVKVVADERLIPLHVFFTGVTAGTVQRSGVKVAAPRQ